MGYKKVIYYLLGTNWIKTVWINFFYFPFNQVLHLPILVSYHTALSLSGGVELCGPISTGMLLLGYRQLGTQDSKGERTYWNVSGKVLISGTKNGIGRGCKIFISGQCIIGGGLCITGNSTIVCRKKISFGNNVLISWDVLIMDTDHHTINDAEGNILNYDKPIVFGDDIWIGCRTTILKGSTVPSNSIVAAGSIVSGKLQKEGCIYTSGGKILKDNISWKR